MDQRKAKISWAIVILVFTMLACNFVAPTEEPQSPPTAIIPPTFVATRTTILASTPTQDNLPQTDREVSRVSVDQAKAAFDIGDAIIVDVRGPEAYARGHILGALEISVSEIQNNPAGLALDKDKWIITYCT